MTEVLLKVRSGQTTEDMTERHGLALSPDDDSFSLAVRTWSHGRERCGPEVRRWCHGLARLGLTW